MDRADKLELACIFCREWVNKNSHPKQYRLMGGYYWYAYPYRIWGKSKKYQRFSQSDNSTFPSYKVVHIPKR